MHTENVMQNKKELPNNKVQRKYISACEQSINLDVALNITGAYENVKLKRILEKAACSSDFPVCIITCEQKRKNLFLQSEACSSGFAACTITCVHWRRI